jgi:type III secretion system FlhB-like substrate exporter
LKAVYRPILFNGNSANPAIVDSGPREVSENVVLLAKGKPIPNLERDTLVAEIAFWGLETLVGEEVVEVEGASVVDGEGNAPTLKAKNSASGPNLARISISNPPKPKQSPRIFQ